MNLTEMAEAVLRFCAQDGIWLTDDLAQVEEAVQTAVRRIGAQAVELHLGRGKLGYAGASRPCACGQRQRFVEHRPKVIATQMGVITIRRAYYLAGSRPCRMTSGSAWAPGPKAWGWRKRRPGWGSKTPSRTPRRPSIA